MIAAAFGDGVFDVPAWAEYGLIGLVTLALLYLLGQVLLIVPKTYLRSMEDIRESAKSAVEAQKQTTQDFISYLTTAQALSTEALVRAADQMTTLTREVRDQGTHFERSMDDHTRDGQAGFARIEELIREHNARHARQRRAAGGNQ